jgi:cobalamin biosynthesis protein CbiG
VGRKVLNSVTIYSNGVVRLPSTYDADKLTVEWDTKQRLHFRVSGAGEVGFKLWRGRGARSPLLNLRRVFRSMNLAPEKIVGVYSPVIKKDKSFMIALQVQ